MDSEKGVFPAVATEEDFQKIYTSHLWRHSPALIEEIRSLLQRTDVSLDVTDCEVKVFPDEYGEGKVSVWMSFNGRNRLVRKNDPSLYCGASVRFASYANDLPLYSPNNYPFETRDVTVNCVIAWFVECWGAAGGEGYTYPVVITGHEGFGTSDLIPLTTVAGA